MAATHPYPELHFSRLPVKSKCPICGAEDGIGQASTYPSQDERFKLCILLFCEHCGSGYMPDADKVLDGYYENTYGSEARFNRLGEPAKFFAELENGRNKTKLVRALAQVEELKSVGANFKSVLDFGAGHGVFLFAAKPKEPFAFELDPQCKKYLDYLGATVIGELPEEKFDVFVASHVVEHLTDNTLDTTVRKLVGSLKRGGIGLIEVPQGGLSLLKKARYQEPHTLFFTPHGITALVERFGVEVLYQGAKGMGDIPQRSNAIYRPSAEGFYSNRKEGLTIVFRRPS